MLIVVDWQSGPTTATVTFSGGVHETFADMVFVSDSFRTLELEMDYCASAHVDPLTPTYGTHQHNNHPPDLTDRTLTIAAAYREAGVDVTDSGGTSVVDDSAAGFATWNVAELHDAMETAFSRYTSTWPNWRMWGMQVGRFDSVTLGGIMFDAPAANGGAGDRPDRQGFAVARSHSWFNDLVPTPSTQAQFEAMRKYLYVWVHEAGHAWNLLHSWDKGRPSSLSWMNYDWRYDAIHGADAFWAGFRMRFDDEELVHIRHGDRRGGHHGRRRLGHRRPPRRPALGEPRGGPGPAARADRAVQAVLRAHGARGHRAPPPQHHRRCRSRSTPASTRATARP